MKLNSIAVIGILALLLAGCVQEGAAPARKKAEPGCEFPEQIGAYKTGVSGEFPIVYPQGTHSYGNSTFVLATYGPVGVKILIFDSGAKALDYFKNSNYYSSEDCEVIDKDEVDCLVESGKSTADRSCTISGVGGRCVIITEPITGSWIAEFEWIEGDEIKSARLTSNAQVERSKKFQFLEPFVEHFKECAVKAE